MDFDKLSECKSNSYEYKLSALVTKHFGCKIENGRRYIMIKNTEDISWNKYDNPNITSITDNSFSDIYVLETSRTNFKRRVNIFNRRMTVIGKLSEIMMSKYYDDQITEKHRRKNKVDLYLRMKGLK